MMIPTFNGDGCDAFAGSGRAATSAVVGSTVIAIAMRVGRYEREMRMWAGEEGKGGLTFRPIPPRIYTEGKFDMHGVTRTGLPRVDRYAKHSSLLD